MATTSHATGSLLRGLRHRGVAVALVVALLATAGVLVLRDGEEPHTVTAHFPRAVSVFVGTDVRVLGVTVGRVTSVTPDGAAVAVEMEYDADVRL
ncbi:MAG: MlaD family protein, partial [Actinomycetota bacterium]|nr:MlaD family protein [Actinomycetota bacterium]